MTASPLASLITLRTYTPLGPVPGVRGLGDPSQSTEAGVMRRLVFVAAFVFVATLPAPSGARTKPHGIAGGLDGAIWFTEYNSPVANNVGRVATQTSAAIRRMHKKRT
jgi:hypothetical protein